MQPQYTLCTITILDLYNWCDPDFQTVYLLQVCFVFWHSPRLIFIYPSMPTTMDLKQGLYQQASQGYVRATLPQHSQRTILRLPKAS